MGWFCPKISIYYYHETNIYTSIYTIYSRIYG